MKDIKSQIIEERVDIEITTTIIDKIDLKILDMRMKLITKMNTNLDGKWMRMNRMDKIVDIIGMKRVILEIKTVQEAVAILILVKIKI